MNKKSIIILLLALVAMAGQGQVRCYVIGTVAEETTPRTDALSATWRTHR